MLQAAREFFNSDNFMPHGHCFLWQPDIFWLHTISDVVIAAAYFGIPVVLICLLHKRRDIPFEGIFILFAAFIVLCGMTHLVSIWVLWHPDYAFQGVLKAVTAAVSIATLFVCIPLFPRILKIPSTRQLEEVNRKLEQATRELEILYNNTKMKSATELEAARIQQEKLIDRLTESNADLERFAYVCSHDLQEPLRMVFSYTQMLEKHLAGALDGKARHYMQYVIEGAAQARQQINDVLRLARMEHNTERLADVDSSLVLEKVLHDIGMLLEERGASVTHGDLPLVHVCQTHLYQLFQNLIANAIKFCETVPQVRVSARREGELWEFCIADNGIGISPEHTHRLFTIFERLNDRKQYPGTGLGLAICQKAVQAYGGRIWIESEQGKGSRFYFTLPAAISNNREPS